MISNMRREQPASVEYALRGRRMIRECQRTMLRTAFWLSFTRPLKLPRRIARVPWTSHTSFLLSCGVLRRGRVSLKRRPIIFAAVRYRGELAGRDSQWCATDVRQVKTDQLQRS